MQLNYNQYQDEAFAGLIANTELTNIRSGACEGAVPFGYGVVGGTDAEKQVKVPDSEVATLVFSVDLVTSNVIDMDINGVSMGSVTFATDHDTTMDLIVTALLLLAPVTECTLTDTGGDNRTIRVKTANVDALVENALVTLGAGQATIATTYSTDEIFRGIAVHTHVMATTGNGDEALYKDKSACGYATKGPIWVPIKAAVALAVDEAVYLIASGVDAGKFTNVSTNNIATGGKCLKSVNSQDLAIVSIDLV